MTAEGTGWLGWSYDMARGLGVGGEVRAAGLGESSIKHKRLTSSHAVLPT